jgi:DNA-binding IclR family transcriptional regulator
MMPDSAVEAGAKIKSADRVLDLFEVLAVEPVGLSFSELVKRLNLPKSSLHGLLSVLVSRQYLALDEDSRRYNIGVQLFDHGQAFLKQHPEAREARAAMANVVATVNESVQLGVLRGAEGVNLATVECSHPLRLQLAVGRHFAAYATSLGKVLLAHLPDDEVRDRVGTGDLERFTEHTFGHVDRLLEELACIRQRGFGLDTEEGIPGVFCVAVPIANSAGHVETGMSVTIPTSRLNADLLSRALASLAAASLQISARIGASATPPQLRMLTDTAQAAAALNASQAVKWLKR